MEGLVVQLQSFGETFERDTQVGRKSLCINASARVVVQFGESYLQRSGPAKEAAQFFLHGVELGLQFDSALQDITFVACDAGMIGIDIESQSSPRSIFVSGYRSSLAPNVRMRT